MATAKVFSWMKMDELSEEQIGSYLFSAHMTKFHSSYVSDDDMDTDRLFLI